MLSAREMRNTAEELQENYRRLGESLDQGLDDLELSQEEFRRVLTMNHPNPADVWMVRDYLE